MDPRRRWIHQKFGEVPEVCERRGMKTRAQGCRCTECRRCFTPAATATGRQKTCSARCRQDRRNRLARRRREEDLEVARDDERDRQRRRRARPSTLICPSVQVDTCTGLGTEPAGEAVSRAGLRTEAGEIMKETLKNLDDLMRVSRASLERQLRRIIRSSSRNPGDARRPGPPCHGPASASKPSKSLNKAQDSLATTSRTGMEVRAADGRHRSP